jgi:hypothetical protein
MPAIHRSFFTLQGIPPPSVPGSRRRTGGQKQGRELAVRDWKSQVQPSVSRITPQTAPFHSDSISRCINFTVSTGLARATRYWAIQSKPWQSRTIQRNCRRGTGRVHINWRNVQRYPTRQISTTTMHKPCTATTRIWATHLIHLQRDFMVMRSDGRRRRRLRFSRGKPAGDQG